MDRLFVYDAALGQSTDILTPQVNAMNGLGKLSEALLGQVSSAASALSCIPSSPAALTVQVLPGQLYSTQTVDAVAFGNSAINSNPLVKQYVLWASKTLSCPAPTTTGFSINYLIEVQPVETDGNLQTLQYFNPAIATNAAAPNWTGPNNTGAQQPTTRTATLNVTAKAGTAAASGSQTTPAPDSGYVGLWVVTVTQGQTTITSGNISQYSGAVFFPTLWQLQALISAFTPPAASSSVTLTQATNQSVTSGIITAAQLSGSGNFFTNASGVLTFTKSGIYSVNASILGQAVLNSTQNLNVGSYIYHNGVMVQAGGAYIYATGTQPIGASCSATFYAAVGDTAYVSGFVAYTSGSAAQLMAAYAGGGTFGSITKLV